MARLETAFITGAASGIGRALARALTDRGCALYLADINDGALDELAGVLREKQVNVHTRSLDVSDRTAVEAAVADAGEKLGSLDVIFNNAGVSLSDTVEKMTYADLEWVMDINFYGVVYGTKAALPGMLARGRGHIVNISSLFGLVGVPSQSAYCAAKHAVKGFNESLAYELDGTGVQVHSVHPGGVDTNIVRSGKHLHTNFGKIAEGEVQSRFEELAITTPDQAATVILEGVSRGDYRILIGKDARWADRLSRWMPNRWRRMFASKLAENGGRGAF